MSFINWGHETPEQKAFRRRMEERALIENAMMRKVFEARGTTSAATSAGASGSGAPLPSTVGPSTAYVYVDLNGDHQIGFIDYALKRFTRVFDTGLNTANTWQHDNINYSATYVVDGKGYAIVFSNIANDHKIFFFTAGGTLLDTIDVNTTDLSIDLIDGQWILLTDFDAERVWWFDGETLRYDFDTFTNCTTWGYSYQSNLDGFFMYQVRNENNGAPQVMHRVLINDGTGFRVIVESDFTATPTNYYTHRAYENSNVLRVATYDGVANEYIKLEYFDADSNSLNDYDISGNDYTIWYSDCYGTGKHIDTFVNTDYYHIRYCDSVRQIYLTVDHNKGANYPDFFVIGTYVDRGGMYDVIPENAIICFNDNTGGYDHDLVLVDYCDFMPMSDLMEDLNYLVTFTEDETKMFGRNLISVSESIFIPQCTNVNANPKILGMFVFSSTGGTGYSPLAGFDTFTFIDTSYTAGTKYILTIGTNGPSLAPGKSFIFNEAGNSYKESEWLDIRNNNLSFRNSGDVVVWRSSNDSNNQSYYYNSLVNISSPVAIDPFGESYETRQYTAPGLLAPSKVILQGGSASRLYRFNDVGDDSISNGGNNMYATGNTLYSGIAGTIPYTHTQINGSTYSQFDEAPLSAFTSNGVVADGDSYFGGGSEYFTNLYPGLFVCVTKNINIDSFGISGDTGTYDSGYNMHGHSPLTIGGTEYTIFYKILTGSGEDFDSGSTPTINQIIIIDSQNSQAVQEIGDTTGDDYHEISELVASGANEIHYLLLSTYNKSIQIGFSETDVVNVATAYLNIVGGLSIANTRTALNQNYSNITNQVDNQDAYWLSILKDNGYTQIVSPYFDGVQVGPNLIAGRYFNDNGKVCVNLYDNNLQLLATHTTEDPNSDSLRVIGDAAYLRTNDGNNARTITILDPTKFTKKTYIAEQSGQFDTNDFVNWC